METLNPGLGVSPESVYMQRRHIIHPLSRALRAPRPPRRQAQQSLPRAGLWHRSPTEDSRGPSSGLCPRCAFSGLAPPVRHCERTRAASGARPYLGSSGAGRPKSAPHLGPQRARRRILARREGSWVAFGVGRAFSFGARAGSRRPPRPLSPHQHAAAGARESLKVGPSGAVGGRPPQGAAWVRKGQRLVRLGRASRPRPCALAGG